MRFSQAETTALLDAAPDAIVIVDSDGCIVLVNAQTEDLFGYRREELLRQPVEQLLPARFRPTHVSHRAAYSRAPNVRPMGAAMELYALRKDGSEFPVEVSLSPLETESGPVITSAIRDVSARKAAEQELIEARTEADRANRAKSAFLAAASHDLRQPLQTLALLNTVLARTTPLGSKEGEVASMQAQAVSSMSDLLNSLLDISKLEAGAITPDIQDCEIRTILERCRAQFTAQAESKGLNLLLEDCDAIARTDPTLLEQIVQNLVANAIRYTEHGQVIVRCPNGEAEIRIQVLDTGPGIDEPELERIFEEFYQVPQSSGHRKEGLGLGLSIVRRAADLLGHGLEVESTPGRGSCFTVKVPRGQARDAAAAANPQADADTERDGGIILIIDDENVVAHATAMLLDVMGYETATVSSFDEAEAWFARKQRVPNMVMCDFHLAAGEKGGETIERIRRMAGRDIPAVLVTGDTSEAMAAASGDVDNCHLLRKPVDGDELLDVVRRLI